MDGPRRPRTEELDSVVDLLCDVWPHFRGRYSREQLRAGIRRPLHRRMARIIVEDGRAVSNIQVLYNYVSVYGSRFKVASIGGVCTREDCRGRGLASAVLGRCLEETAAAGARILYVSGDRGIYRRNHCVKAGQFFQVELRPDSLVPAGASVPAESSVSLRRVSTGDWPMLAPLHQAEPVRFLRRADFLSRTVFWWDEFHPEIWLVERDRRALAYLVLAPPRWAEPGDTTGIVTEYAGSRAAILAALPSLFEVGAVSSALFSVPAWDRDMLHLLAGLGAPLTPVTLPDHTIRLLNLPGLIQQLRGHLAALLPRRDLRRLSFGQQGEKCLLKFGEQEAELDLSQAARLVFGAPDAPDVSGDLGQVLSRIFPLPIPPPGVNFI